jgi:hypothetical protein
MFMNGPSEYFVIGPLGVRSPTIPRSAASASESAATRG